MLIFFGTPLTSQKLLEFMKNDKKGGCMTVSGFVRKRKDFKILLLRMENVFLEVILLIFWIL